MLNENFSRKEFACKCGCGFNAVDAELLAVLVDLRERWDRALIITSGNRCPDHNKAVGGAPQSKHTQGIAVDFKIIGVHEDEVADYLETKYPTKYGIGRYAGRTHVDVRPEKARWDTRGSDNG